MAKLGNNRSCFPQELLFACMCAVVLCCIPLILSFSASKIVPSSNVRIKRIHISQYSAKSTMIFKLPATHHKMFLFFFFLIASSRPETMVARYFGWYKPQNFQENQPFIHIQSHHILRIRALALTGFYKNNVICQPKCKPRISLRGLKSYFSSWPGHQLKCLGP